ncbi:hypothetical protein evm_014425 [Chilo suppressalis]|nr:hypothetical protein evm_014425 [Chilo suppressalis]
MRDCRVVFLVQYSGALSSYKCRDCCRLYVVLQNRSVSVIMRDCRVVFLVQYSGARLEIADRANHCDGQLAHVQAARVFAGNKLERGSLRVNGAETLGSAEPPVVSAAALPELGGARYWAGGRPPGAPALAPPLRGCLGGLTVDRHLYSLLDTPARHGLEPSCEPRVSMVQYFGHVASAAALPELDGGLFPGFGAALVPPMRGCLGGLTVDRHLYSLLDTPARHGLEPSCEPRVSMVQYLRHVASAAALPELGGGLSSGFGAAVVPPMRGCLGGITVDRHLYSLLDTPARHGLEPSCEPRVSIIQYLRCVASAAALPELDSGMFPGCGAALVPPMRGCLGGLTVDRHLYSLLDTPARHGLEPSCEPRVSMVQYLGHVASAAALPELGGGLSSGFGAAVVPPLRGCLGGLTVDRHLYSLLDTPARHGLEPSCEPRVSMVPIPPSIQWPRCPTSAGGRSPRPALAGLMVRSAAFEGSGFIELSSPALKRKSSIGISFRARGPGLLLYRTPDMADAANTEHENHYLALMIIEGDLQLIAAAGKTELRLRTNGTKFDDDHLHAVRIIRVHKQLELWVDDVLETHGTLAGGAIPARPHGLFLGGVNDTMGGYNASFPTTGFTGTIADIIVDAQAQALLLDRGLVFSLDFSTFQPDGLLVLALGSKAKPKHYLALMIREGKLKLVVRGRKRRELSLVAFVADGTWRSVSVSVSRTRVALWSGSQSARAATVGPARARRLYVGGLPAPAAPRALPPAVSVSHARGAMERVAVGARCDGGPGARAAPLRGRAARARRPTRPTARGDAYASVSDVEFGSEVRVRFRSAASRALLLAADGLLLELRDGKVIT